MTCPNCGLANADNAKFCANCGTSLGSSASQPYNPYPGQQPQYQQSIPPQPMQPPGGQSVAKNIAIGCSIAVLIVILFGLSCTRACFRHRRYYRLYGAAIPLVVPAPSLGVR
ncbi:MAG TPA: zinc-ribbon domain-containing protein [Bryobacteraceae bacterium]|nr:zinc-ribbon domain-containing protein [Bryobacteraceae bacterium]